MTANPERPKMSADEIAAEARMNGGTMCPKCKTWNLKHKRMCVKCSKRLKPSPTMIKQEAERVAKAAPDPRSVGKTVEADGRRLVMTKGKAVGRNPD